MEVKKCPCCGAPLFGDSSNNDTIVCTYCGNEVWMTTELEENLDELTESINNLSNSISSLNQTSKNIYSYLKPEYDDEGCKKKIVECLVCTDFVPLNIFKGFKLYNILREFYPIYVYDVNWKADWSATFTKQVSHEEPTYDYKGNVTGRRTVNETLYRDVNGVSAGNSKVILSGNINMPRYGEIVDKICKRGIPVQEAYANYDSNKYAGWKEIESWMTSSEAWQSQEQVAEKQMENDVSSTVLTDIRSRADWPWRVQNHDYVYHYHYGASRCILIPLFAAEYEYKEQTYEVTVEANSGEPFLHMPIPQDFDEIGKKENHDKKIKSAKWKQVLCYCLFGGFALAALLEYVFWFTDGVMRYFFIALIASIISGTLFFFARFFHQKNRNAKDESTQMLYESKERRKENAKKEFGYDVNIGEAPRKKKFSRVVDVVVYLLLLSLIAASILVMSHSGTKYENQYRKATENSFEQCESAIDKGDFDKGTVLLDALGKRTLTNRQAKRFEKTKKAMLEMGLNGLENSLAAITNNSNIPDGKDMSHIKKNLADFNAYQLDASQTERLKKAKENYIELQLGKMEEMVGLYKADTRLSHYYNEINRVAQDVREMELSSTQKTRVENAISEAEKIKNQEEVSRKKQKDAEAIAFIEKFYSYALGKNATGWTDAVLEQYLGPAVLKYLSEDFGEIITSPLLYCDPVGDYDFVGCTKAVAMEDGRYRKDFTSKFYFDSSKIYGSIFYTVETINGKMRITKIELVSRDD